MTTRKASASFTKLLDGNDFEGALAYVRSLGPSAQGRIEMMSDLLGRALDAKQAGPARVALNSLKVEDLQEDVARALPGRLAAAGLHAESLELLGRLPQAERDRFGMLEQEARSYSSLGRTEDAERVYQRINQLYPTAFKGWQMSARFYRAQRDAAREAEHLLEALKFKLKDAAILKRLAVLKAALHDHREALELWRQVARADAEDQEAALGVLRQLIRLKRFDQAADWLAAREVMIAGDAEGDKLIAHLAGRNASASASA